MSQPIPADAAGQWGYHANRSTRGRLDWNTLGRRSKPRKRKAGTAELERRVRELEAENRRLLALLEPRRRPAARPDGWERMV